MSFRLPSPPRGGRRGGDADHRAEPSVAGSPLGPRRPSKPRSRRVASSKPAPAPLPAHSSAVLHTPPQSQQQEGSESESELDSPISPPRLIFVTQPEEPGTPTSPGGGSPPSIDMKPAMSPKGSTFGSDTEEWHSLDFDDDPYFNSLVENFIIAAEDVRKSTLPDDNIDKKGDHQRKSDLYAESVLNHYNNDKKNKIKYELISAITSWEIMDEKGCYSHVNFRAKENQENSKELFFAELRWDCKTIVPTCVLSLKGQPKVGGLCDTVYDKFYAVGVPIDSQHCYACLPGLKHPKNGELYETGHVAMSVYYNG